MERSFVIHHVTSPLTCVSVTSGWNVQIAFICKTDCAGTSETWYELRLVDGPQLKLITTVKISYLS